MESGVEIPNVKILVADDEFNISSGLKEVLQKSGYLVDVASDGNRSAELVEKELYNLAIVDLKMPGPGGLEILRRIREKSPDTIVIIITAYGTVSTAVDAIKSGAYDYITKPMDIKRLRLIVDHALEHQALIAENKELRSRLEGDDSLGTIVARSQGMRKVTDIVKQVALSDVPVLLQGETGTGKELVARSIHQRSQHREGPFIALNCGAVPDNLFESELFGHTKGAFTGAHADRPGRFHMAQGGTLFLDEITEIPLQNQVDLLRVLEEKEFQAVGGTDTIKSAVRIISATNRDLQKAVEDGSFREDLYYRLNVVPIELPPLRDRKEDIPVLIESFLEQFCHIHRQRSRRICADAMRALIDYRWPGNVRELKNTVERIVVTSSEQEIKPEHLPLQIQSAREPSHSFTVGLGISIQEMEKRLIRETLTHVSSNRKQAASALGISLRTLQYKLKEYKLL